MKAFQPAIIVVSILVLLALLPGSLAGSCLFNSQGVCRNSTGYIAAGTRFTTQLNAYDGSSTSCSGQYFDENNLVAITECTPGCCCSGSVTTVLGQYTCSAADYRPIYNNLGQPSSSCTQACSGSPPPQNYCNAAACYCNGLPYDTTTQQCCLDGSLINKTDSCTVVNSCPTDTDLALGTTCSCGSITIDDNTTNRACCSSGGTALNATACTPPPVGTGTCGDLTIQPPEQCDTSSSSLGPPGCTASQVCTASCTCVDVTVTLPSCGNGRCELGESYLNCPSDCQQQTCTSTQNTLPSWTQKPFYDPDTNTVTMSWSHPQSCPDLRAGYRVQRSSKGVTNSLTSPDETYGYPDITKDTTSFTDHLTPADIAGTTNLYYSLIIEFTDGTSRNITEQLSLPDPLCPVADYSYCKQDASGQTAVTCNGRVASTVRCSGANGNICSLVNGVPTCVIASSQCSQCNGQFACFPDDTAQVNVVVDRVTGNSRNVACSSTESTCYKDIANTSVELYLSCTTLDSCTDYRTQTACTQNKCAKPGNCVWTPFGVPGYGICTQGLPQFQNCSQCENLASCTQQACKAINASCIYYTAAGFTPPIVMPAIGDPACRPSGGLPCEYIKTQSDCSGTSTFRLDANHNILSSSSDIFGDGKCAWINSECVKDSDASGAADYNDPRTNRSHWQTLQLDFTSPSTSLLATPGITYGSNFNISYSSTSQSDTLYVCFQRTGGLQPDCTDFTAAYDGVNTRTNPDTYFVQRTFLANESGVWGMRYYSEDEAFNLEPMRNFLFTVDATPLQVTITNQTYTQLHIASGYRLQTYFGFSTSKPANCNTSLNNYLFAPTSGIQQGSPTPENPIASPDADLKNAGLATNFSVLYPGVSPGDYTFVASCTDDAGNTAQQQVSFTSYSDFTISNALIRDNAGMPPRKATSLTIGVSTARAATCSYVQRGTTSSPTQYTTTGGLVHSATLMGLSSQSYAFQSVCNIGGSIIQGSTSVDNVFAIDNSAPITALCDASVTPANCTVNTTQPRESYTLSFGSTDQPANSLSFGVANISACVQNVTDPACTPTLMTSQKLILNYNMSNGQGLKVRFFANDKAGNTESIHEQLVDVTDLSPPSAPTWSISQQTGASPLKTSSSQPGITAAFTAEKARLLSAAITNDQTGATESVSVTGDGSSILLPTTATYNNFLSSPQESLANGNYTITIVASDANGNQNSYTKQFQVSNPSSQSLWLIQPQFGGTTSILTNVIIGSQYTSLCKWYNQNKNIVDPQIFTTVMKPFSSSTGTTHTISDIYGQIGITSIAMNQSIDIAVTCNLTTSTGQTRLSADHFTLTYVSQAPLVTFTANPPTLVDINNPSTTLNVQTDQDTWCDLGGSPVFGAETFTGYNTSKQGVYADPNPYDGSPYIDLVTTCKNRAGLSAQASLRLFKAYSTGLGITLGSPLITSVKSYSLNFTVNKAAACTVAQEPSTLNKNVTLQPAGSSTFFRSASTIPLIEGVNNFTAHCVYDTALVDYSLPPLDYSFTVTLDTSPPVVSILGLQGISCGLTSTSFFISAQDNGTGIANLTYTITNQATGAVVVPLTYQDPSQPLVSFPDGSISLINNSNYVVSARAQDFAGSWSAVTLASQKTIIATDPGYPACDTTPPDSYAVQAATLNGTYVAVRCTDLPPNTGVGCGGYYYGLVTCPSQRSTDACLATCTASSSNFQSINSPDLVVDYRSMFCWNATDTRNNIAATNYTIIDLYNDSGSVTIVNVPSKYQRLNFPFTFTTDRLAFCNLTRTSVSQNSVVPPLTQVWPDKATSWTLPQTISDGEYQYSITCSNGQQPAPSVASADIVVDSVPPTLSGITVDNATCGLNSLQFSFNASDQPGSNNYMSGVGFYGYRITAASGGIVADWTNSTTATVNRSGLTFTDGTQYTLTAQVFDNAGNPSTTKTSQFIGTASNSFRCDKNAPTTGYSLVAVSPALEQLMITCTDSLGSVQSGCNSTYWLSIVGPATACTVSTSSAKYTLGAPVNITQAQNICWIVHDNNDLRTTSNATLSGPPQQNITLLTPQNGGSTTLKVDAVFSTTYASNCRWGTSTPASVNEFNAYMHAFDTVSGQYLTLLDAFTKLNVTLAVPLRTIFVSCLDGTTLTTRSFAFQYAPNAPQLSFTVNPQSIADANSPTSTISILADQDVMCTSPTPGAAVTSPAFSPAQTIIFTANTSRGAYTQSVQFTCANRAGVSATRSTDISVDFSQPLTISTSQSEPLFTKAAANSQYTLNFTTNRNSTCTLTKDTCTKTATASKFSMACPLTTGNNTFSISCAAGPFSASKDINVIQDSVAPVLSSIISQPSTCSLSSLTFQMNASDASPSSGMLYNYSVSDSVGTVASGVSSTGDVTAQLQLAASTQYAITATASDLAGNAAAPKSLTVTATDTNDPSCDHTPPTIAPSVISKTGNGTAFVMTCTDNLACKQTYNIGFSAPGATCAVNKQASYQWSDAQFVEETTTVCWSGQDIANNAATGQTTIAVVADSTPLVINVPSGVVNTTAYTFKVSTNKDAYCSAWQGTGAITLNPVGSRALSFAGSVSLARGTNNFTISCRARPSDQPTVVNTTLFSDVETPSVSAVVAPKATCSLASLSFTVQASDGTAATASQNTGIDHYTFTVKDPSGNIVASGTSPTPDIAISNPAVSDGTTYTISASAADKAGHTSNTASTTTLMQATTNLACDSTPPTTSAIIQPSIDQTSVMVTCNDASGCKDAYWVHNVSLGASCSVTKQANYLASLSHPLMFDSQATICWIVEDTAGNDAAAKQANVTLVAGSQPVIITFTTLNTSAARNYTLGLTTDRKARCSATADGASFVLQPDSNTRAYSWAGTRTFTEGLHSIQASCTDDRQPQPSAAGLNLLIDTAAPVITGISTQQNLCGLQGLFFSVNATDKGSGISTYSYELDSQGNAVWGVSSQSPIASYPAVQFTAGATYQLVARAIDAAGNPSLAYSVDLFATTSTDTTCDYQPPNSALVYSTQPDRTQAWVSCSDVGPAGCNSTYWYNAVANSSTQACSVSMQTSQKHDLSERYNYTQDMRACWIVQDKNKNVAAVQQASVPGPVSQAITLIQPANGGTNNSATDFVVETRYAANCSYRQGTLPITDPNTYLLMTPITERSADSTVHYVRSLYSKLGVAPQQGTVVSVAVSCNDGFNLTAAVFRIIFTSVPATITVTSAPNPIVDPTSPVMNVTVNADQDVRCTINGATLGGDFATVQKAVYTDAPGTPSPYGVTISCVNRAGMVTAQTLTVNTDYYSSIKITQTSNKTWKSGPYTLQFTTDKSAYCTASRNNNDIPLAPSSTFSATSFSSQSGETLPEGTSVYTISCTNGLSPTPTLANATVAVDSKPPVLTAINVQNNTCDLSNLRFSIQGSDPAPGTGIVSYNYTVKNKATGASIASATTRNPDVSIATSLADGTAYTISATAMDAAANPSNMVSKDVTASGQNNTICDTTPPTTQLHQNATAGAVIVTVACQDASGCNQNYYLNIVTSGACTVNTADANEQDTLGNQHTITRDSTVCWAVSDVAGNNASGLDIVRVSGGANSTLSHITIANATVNGKAYTDNLEEATVLNAVVVGDRIISGTLASALLNGSIISGTISDGIILGTTPPPFTNSTLDSCNNGILDSGESDVDCGGLVCADLEGKLCNVSQSCLSSKDCTTNFCLSNICTESSCSDGLQDGLETGVDCGGPCGACQQQYSGCVKDSDCTGGTVCNKGACTQPVQEEIPSPTATPRLGLFNLILIVLGSLCSLGGIAYVLLNEEPKKPQASEPELAELEEPIATFETSTAAQPKAQRKKSRMARMKLRERRSVLSSFQTPEELSALSNVSHEEIENAYTKFDKSTFTDATKQLLKEGKVEKKDVAVALTDLKSSGKAEEDAIEALKKEFGIGDEKAEDKAEEKTEEKGEEKQP